MTTPQPSPYSEIKRSLTDFHIALEAARQRAILDRALAALGAGKSEEASRIIKELSNPQAGKGILCDGPTDLEQWELTGRKLP